MEKPIHNGKNFGLKIEPRKPTDYHRIGGVFSPLTKPVLFADGHGIGNYLPNPEIQKSDYDDWMDCVTESFVNCIETLLNIGNINKNFSKRALAKLDGTTREGNSQGAVADTARNKGVISEPKWPRDRSMNWDTYYATIPQNIINLGTEFKNNFDIAYEYIGTDAESLKGNLKHGPIQVIGYAWSKDANGIYHDYGYQPNHAFMLYDFVDGQCWRIYDSYPADFIIDDNSTKQEFMKELAWDYKFGSALQMVITIKKNNNSSLLTNFLLMFKNMKAYMDNHGLHLFYIDQRGKQEIVLSSIFEKAVAMSAFANKEINTTDWPSIQKLPDFKFF